MRIELTRFRVRDGAGERVAEWMGFLNANAEAVRETLEPEQMYVETIFTEKVEGVQYLYWYSVQGEVDVDVALSEHWLDQHHVTFWRECIDDEYPPVDLTPLVHMVPERVIASMKPLD
ncbi:DUF6176 family protein [Microbacterium halophytorum]|uniref:DUF6176 family protein n=1 Tax=Microbacterium halophytorum TaxID=2067568 RepID=UPI000CFCFEC0|nr:DUF6176 family protein [Microbacterium halophytorum]